ncbi:DUF1376 domain-containing protein [Methylobacterium oryzisoli]|uniref:DUF1376 domain-containing protein n=1 Tax=Methylobacterium oryzisoli TaxID=3385502 RepID=UPI003891965E
MTTTDLPAPPVPADTDISGFARFMLDVDRLFASELWALSTGEEFKAAMALWGRAWQQTPAGSLPDDDRLLAAFSGTHKRWPKVREMALRGFVKCSDGRLYHRVLCEEVARAAKHKREQHERTSRATEARRRKGDDQPSPPSGARKLNGINKTDERHVGRHDDRDVGRDGERNDVRHEQRHDPHVPTVTRSNRQDIDKTEERESPPPPVAHPARRESGPGSGGGDAWQTRENFDRVLDRCRALLGDLAPCCAIIGPIVRLEADGYVWDDELAPALLDVSRSQRSAIRTWALMARIAKEHMDRQRLSQTARSGAAAKPVPDALHAEHEGCRVIWEQTLRPLIQADWADLPDWAPLWATGHPVYNATTAPNGTFNQNPAMAGTTGNITPFTTAGGVGSGQLVTGYTLVAANMAGITAVFSKGTDSDGYATQVIELSGTAGASAPSIALQGSLSGLAAGQTVAASCRMKLAAGHKGIKQIFNMLNSGGTGNGILRCMYNAGPLQPLSSSLARAFDRKFLTPKITLAVNPTFAIHEACRIDFAANSEISMRLEISRNAVRAYP